MSDPLTFDSASPRLGLPLLFAGQSQKEVFVNEAHALADALLHCAIEGEAAAPPASPTEGENWLVAADATGDWLDRDGAIACRQGGNWLFVTPIDGMRVLDRSTGQDLRYFAEWKKADAVVEPSAGSTVDSEARTAIGSLILALRAAGVLPAS
ncbi:DUF2793 domain-containing protein [Novosphingobium album (ex Liu et al. 2023)]|uniref:DUF2793 domain-containing protein n=1 Tax=Novosphingobium album (ex Liu et al. 2023) TaxID=3031130 RepID=A0ABT5WNH2_9SPHN|nr:DUF2793 domain-containing protein [Novosphingobium album (ex Liu et al. 2023)]MDE8650817.1 DUF2793 domain-containing protein [Novosphingobium album (ex Liu et al. 2023)]